jgi:hypothetical protein
MLIDRLAKILILGFVLLFASLKLRALPDYLKQSAADPFSRPELRTNCTTCHLSPQGGGERNAFGKAFEAAGFRITDELRRQFPDRFLLPGAPSVPVSFVPGSDSQAVVEINWKKFLIDTRTRTVEEAPADSSRETVGWRLREKRESISRWTCGSSICPPRNRFREVRSGLISRIAFPSRNTPRLIRRACSDWMDLPSHRSGSFMA